MDDDHKHKFPMIARKRWVDVPVSSYGYCGYVIEYKRMDSPEKLLGWIHHLCEKCNLTTEHIWQLIEIAKDRGVKIDFNS